MARRAPPQNAAMFGVPPQRRALNDPNESAFSWFIREEVLAPEKLVGNISIFTAVGVFAAGVFAARTWGDLIVPA
ncbi:hypothetical protein JVT61DRAFT_11195 [Boletus reticuloceps]|uniref:Uncharacterized protein n=1 Tax=Boletus reticuloceps TaxID=495285 RepID=A0A8I2YC66_9AGAM|nr:hypothetical protein EV363DRAFT_1163078 [Boletus edulis]KAG6369255.1 hypothetical protein JVT61DRAFT_15561 [Boletus reticuloceps]KAG6370675.1 hypothetical protein JVT61DRAFT_11195 [Boletus reticuloceps]